MKQTLAMPLTVGMFMLISAATAFAAPPAKTPTRQDEPDVVLGSSSRAMAIGLKNKAAGTPATADGPQRWTVEIKDVNLANTFQRWAGSAGWKVRWDAAKHVMVEAPDTVTGTFEEAIEAQLSSPGIATSSYPLEVCFYPNTPPLARITRKGEQTQECK
ncbi:toxin co-regulated pilus biosynthesis Q family protein [Variovorax sp. ZS18.2.2]|uniref:toxin co-regulated pilus biosynthesis Q family protein n=1 Tax=Variovorax sp. ZS18.2.2 TaxID=2971255 RepID=UPI002151F62A|nr:toxin co-regulated pilus biosynthesis Q family protein [Variovorax sp. ZS18.2.2]MCR6481012.1 toxin co-regulated pilus biosynthesis Q family protein [Variovorax sp. ZS18.2.2]